MRSIQLFFIVFAFLGLYSCGGNGNATAVAQQVIEDLDPATFQSTFQDKGGILLDVRTPAEVAKGVLEGATVINIQDANFDQRVATMDREKPVFVYCKSGGRSARASGILENMGFHAIYNLDGGITAWKKAGLPTVIPE